MWTVELDAGARWNLAGKFVCFANRLIPLSDRLSRFAYYQFWLHDNLFPEPLSSMNPVQDALCRHPSHVGQWLSDGREPWVIELRRLDIVESNDRNISGHLHPRILQGAYRAYGRHVIEGDQGCEPLAV